MTKPIWALDATETASLIRAGKLSAREAVDAHLARLEVVNPKLNAVVRVLAEEARAEALKADEAQAQGKPLGPLHGVPFTTKINVDQKGQPTDNGVVLLKDLVAKEDSPHVAHLRNAGAISIGRTNSPAFAMRATTDNALHGLTLNPWNREVTCGGSSGGAGASLAVGIGAFAQGNDIGGSIRWPSYCNGVAGLRPTIGRVPGFNGTATAPRAFAAQLMSVNGPMARSIRDLRLTLAIMSKADSRDPVWVDVPTERPRPPNARRAAVVIEDSLPPGIKATMRRAARHLQDAGYDVAEATLPSLDRLPELWASIGLSEIATLLRPLLPATGDAGIQAFIESFWKLRGETDIAAYQAALRERETILHQWRALFSDRPVVLLPSCAERSVPVGIDTQGEEAVQRLLQAIRYQLSLPVLGLPGVAVPMHSDDGLPDGIQVISPRFREDIALDAAEAIEAREPPVTPIDPKW